MIQIPTQLKWAENFDFGFPDAHRVLYRPVFTEMGTLQPKFHSSVSTNFFGAESIPTQVWIQGKTKEEFANVFSLDCSLGVRRVSVKSQNKFWKQFSENRVVLFGTKFYRIFQILSNHSKHNNFQSNTENGSHRKDSTTDLFSFLYKTKRQMNITWIPEHNLSLF